jgi:hypothetical protein
MTFKKVMKTTGEKVTFFNFYYCTSDDRLASFIPAASKVQHMSDGGQLTIRVV